MQFAQTETTIIRINKISVNKEMLGQGERGKEAVLRPLH